MKQRIIVKLFGSFEITTDQTKTLEVGANSGKIAELLAFLLIYRQQKLTRENIMNSLWGEDKNNNPISALKTTVHRARKSLEILGDERYILSRRGGYQWNEEIPTIVDVEEFDYYCKIAKNEELPVDERINACENAMNYYTGDFMDGGNGQQWMSLLATYYRGEMFRIYILLCELYHQKKAWSKMEKACVKALQQQFVDEKIYYYLLMVKVVSGNENEIKKIYADAEHTLKGEMGLKRIDQLDSLLVQDSPLAKEEKVKSFGDVRIDSGEIKEHGAFYCSYAVFCEIYQLEYKKIKRSIQYNRNTKSDSAILLINVNINQRNNKKRVLLDYEIQEDAMETVQHVLNDKVRECDVVCRCSAYQYVLLLDNCDQVHCCQIEKRIKNMVHKKDKTIKIQLEHKMLREIEDKRRAL